MKAVGVKKLKAQLSEYLRMVKAGETVLVTEREEVIAELRPAKGKLQPVGAFDEIIDALAATGEVTPPRLPMAGWRFESRSLGLPPGTTQEILDELRREWDE